MKSGDKVPNDVLVNAALELMRRAGKPLERLPSKGTAMLYRTPDGKTVRVRSCNDHMLVALAQTPNEGARLNIEGTDLLLLVMPQIQRTFGAVVAYLVPTEVAVEAVRRTHREWLASNPNTKGENRTWCIWFDQHGPAKANDFARHWARYRLDGSVSTAPKTGGAAPEAGRRTLGEFIAEHRRQIAEFADVPFEAVKISLDLTRDKG